MCLDIIRCIQYKHLDKYRHMFLHNLYIHRHNMNNLCC